MDPILDLGAGDAVLLLHGFGLQPATYRTVAGQLAREARVVVPPLFTEPGWSWTPQRVLERLLRLIDDRGLGDLTLIGHSFGGALALELAARHPDLVRELVFVDTLALSREWTLAAEAVHPMHLLWMATPRAAADFATTVVRHPLGVARAAWWGFRSDRRSQLTTVRSAGIPAHVLWADRDSLLTRDDGESFARDLGADFTVVHGRGGRPVDHDWIYRHPELLVPELERLGVAGGGGTPAPPRVLPSSDCATETTS